MLGTCCYLALFSSSWAPLLLLNGIPNFMEFNRVHSLEFLFAPWSLTSRLCSFGSINLTEFDRFMARLWVPSLYTLCVNHLMGFFKTSSTIAGGLHNYSWIFASSIQEYWQTTGALAWRYHQQQPIRKPDWCLSDPTVKPRSRFPLLTIIVACPRWHFRLCPWLSSAQKNTSSPDDRQDKRFLPFHLGIPFSKKQKISLVSRSC